MNGWLQLRLEAGERQGVAGQEGGWNAAMEAYLADPVIGEAPTQDSKSAGKRLVP